MFKAAFFDETCSSTSLFIPFSWCINQFFYLINFFWSLNLLPSSFSVSNPINWVQSLSHTSEVMKDKKLTKSFCHSIQKSHWEKRKKVMAIAKRFVLETNPQKMAIFTLSKSVQYIHFKYWYLYKMKAWFFYHCLIYSVLLASWEFQVISKKLTQLSLYWRLSWPLKGSWKVHVIITIGQYQIEKGGWGRSWTPK